MPFDPIVKMNAMNSSEEEIEKKASSAVQPMSNGSPPAYREMATADATVEVEGQNSLKRNLKGRHMQMIAIGMKLFGNQIPLYLADLFPIRWCYRCRPLC